METIKQKIIRRKLAKKEYMKRYRLREKSLKLDLWFFKKWKLNMQVFSEEYFFTWLDIKYIKKSLNPVYNKIQEEKALLKYKKTLWLQ